MSVFCPCSHVPGIPVMRPRKTLHTNYLACFLVEGDPSPGIALEAIPSFHHRLNLGNFSPVFSLPGSPVIASQPAEIAQDFMPSLGSEGWVIHQGQKLTLMC